MTVCTKFLSQRAPMFTITVSAMMRSCTDRPIQHGGDVPDQFYDGRGESQAHQYVDGAHQHVRHLFFKPEKSSVGLY
jgi:hypothetical protein